MHKANSAIYFPFVAVLYLHGNVQGYLKLARQFTIAIFLVSLLEALIMLHKCTHIVKNIYMLEDTALLSAWLSMQWYYHALDIIIFVLKDNSLRSVSMHFKSFLVVCSVNIKSSPHRSVKHIQECLNLIEYSILNQIILEHVKECLPPYQYNRYDNAQYEPFLILRSILISFIDLRIAKKYLELCYLAYMFEFKIELTVP